MIVRVWNTRPLFGSVTPNESKSLNSPMASSSPNNRPLTDASTPMITDSSMTLRNT